MRRPGRGGPGGRRPCLLRIDPWKYEADPVDPALILRELHIEIGNFTPLPQAMG